MRGHQVRKNYKVICWAVGVLEKVVLRWRRRGVGLRGFRSESETIDDESEDDEDIAKVFRNQKVNVAIDEAVSRVLSMVESQEAQQQYHRMLQRFRQAKVSKTQIFILLLLLLALMLHLIHEFKCVFLYMNLICLSMPK